MTEPDPNPSGWSRRLPVAILALVGCGVATYLTLYQWHLTSAVWDPLFGSRSSEAVLTSATSRLLPLPDATLGALAYIVEVIVTLVGNTERWRSAPRLVLLYGIVLAALALTSLALVLTQLILVHALCTLCLCSAGISFVNAWLGHDEVLAAVQALSGQTSHGGTALA
jgi:uncharacterized membrane protein